MKKIILLSFFIVSSAMMTSCTADAIPDNAIQQGIQADDTGGQNGQLPPPPPPPKPPFG